MIKEQNIIIIVKMTPDNSLRHNDKMIEIFALKLLQLEQVTPYSGNLAVGLFL